MCAVRWEQLQSYRPLGTQRLRRWTTGFVELFKRVLSFHIHYTMGVMPHCSTLVWTRLFSLLSATFVLYCSVCSLHPWIYFAFVSLAHESSNNSSGWLMIQFVVQRSQDILYQEGLWGWMGKPRKPDGKNYLPKVTQQVWGRARMRITVQFLNRQH